MHHDEHLLQLIIDDLAPTQQLLELLKEESLALYGRDMRLLEEILARKQSLIVLLEQHGRKRSEILVSLGLPADHDGLAQLASHSSVGDRLLTQSVALNQLLAQCQEANLLNGQSIQLQQATTANQLRILHGG
ncbi:flagellar protein FlgN, partial [Acinetobacter bohemicus]